MPGVPVEDNSGCNDRTRPICDVRPNGEYGRLCQEGDSAEPNGYVPRVVSFSGSAWL